MEDYEYYRLGCEQKGIRPLSRLRFMVAFAAYERDKASSTELIAATPDAAKRLRLVARWTKLAKIAALVHRGKIIAGADGPDLVAAGFGSIPPDDRERLIMQTPGSGVPRKGWSTKPNDERRDRGDSAPGVREPRRPVTPTLDGACALALPNIAFRSIEEAAREVLFACVR